MKNITFNYMSEKLKILIIGIL